MRDRNGDMVRSDRDIQLETEILQCWERIIFLDGPTGCGKTRFLKGLQAEGVLIVPMQELLETLIGCLQQNKARADIYRAIDAAYPCKILCLEDIDLSLAGKPATQEEVAIMLRRLSDTRKIILTGISLQDRCSVLLDRIGEVSFKYFDFPQ